MKKKLIRKSIATTILCAVFMLGMAVLLPSVSAEPPALTVELGNPTVTVGSDTYASCSTPIWFNATAPINGVYRMRPRIQIDVAGTWTDEFYTWIYDNDANDLDPTVGAISYMRNFLNTGYYRIRIQRADDTSGDAVNRSSTAWEYYYTDCTPPDVTIELGNPTYNDGSDDYASCLTPIWFNATDDDLGVYRIRPHVEIDTGSGWTLEFVSWIYDNDANDLDPTVGNMSYMRYFLTDCDHRIRMMYAYDLIGNFVQTARTYYKVDCTPGVTTKTVGEPYAEGEYVVTSATPLTLDAVDMGTCQSGIAEIWYSIDGGAPVMVSGDTATAYFPGGGVHDIAWYCVDNLGNTEAMQPVSGPQEHYVDDYPPVLTVEVGGPTYNDGTDTYATCLTPIWFNATDDVGVYRMRPRIQIDTGSGWTNEFYSWIYDNDANDLDPTVGAISYMRYFLADCDHRIQIQRTDDLVDNRASTAWEYYKVDCTAGSTTKTVGDPNYQSGYWVKTTTPLYLDALDVGTCQSGIAEIWYSIDGGAPVMVPGAAATVYFPTEGLHDIQWWCVDNLGNTEAVQPTSGPQEHMVDDSPPIIWVNIGDPKIVVGAEEYYVACDTEIEIGVTDEQSPLFDPTAGRGVTLYYNFSYDGMMYYYTDTDDVTFEFGDFFWSDDCDHILYVEAVDDLGNKATLPPLMFHVDCTGPAITKTIGDPQYMGGYWIESTTPLTFTGNDNVGPCVSGVMELHVLINGDPYIIADGSTITLGDLGYGEGLYTLEFYAVDNLGNVGPSTFQDHAIDNGPPTSYKMFNGPICGNVPPVPGWQLLKTYELMGTSPETWYNDVVDLSDYAGQTIQLAWRYYSDDQYLGAIDDVTILEDGMVVYSEDFDSYSDDGYYTPGPFPPGWTTEGYGTPCYSSLKYWGAESYKRHSLPNSMACYYNCPNDDWVMTPEFTFDEGSEYALDYWYFHDDSWDIYLDLYIQLILDEPSGEPEGPVWITSDTEICFHSYDTASGVESLYIEVWWDSDNNGSVDTITDMRYIEDNNPNDADSDVGKIAFCMTLDEECYHEIYYYATDYFGHVEETHMELDHVDNTPPIVNKTFDGPGQLDYLFLNTETVITLEATDLPPPPTNGSGGGNGGGGDYIYWNDFETDEDGWTVDTSVGDWEWTNTYDVNLFVPGGYTCEPPDVAYSGTGLWGTVMYGPYSNSGSETTLSQTFDFTGWSNVELSFASWSDLFGSWDYGQVFVNGVEVFYVDDYHPGCAWTFETIDLSAYDGMSGVEIVFSVHASTVVNYAGWYIDDILIGGNRGRNTDFINEAFDTWLPTGWTTNTFTQSFTNNAGGTSPEAELYWLDATGNDYLTSAMVDTSGASSLTLEFRDYVDHYTASCYFFVEVYDGSTWIDVTPWTNPVTADRPATLWTIDLSSYTSSETQIRFSYGYDSWNINWWDIDDVHLYGISGGGTSGGCASGTVLIEYRIWNTTAGWGDWITYWNASDPENGTGPFSFAEGCTHYLQYRAVDCLGNTLLCEDDLNETEEERGGYPGKMDPGASDAKDNSGIVIDEPHIPATYNRDDVVVLEEGFNTAVPPSGWTLIQYSVPPNPYTWGMAVFNPYEGTGYASCEYDSTYTSVQDEWLISPSFSLDGLTDAELSFAWFSSYYWGYDPYNNYDLEVYASSDGGSNWDLLWVEDQEDPWVNWEWYPKTLDLSAYDGETDVQIALVYYGYDGAQGAFDAVMVTAAGDTPPPPPPPGEELNITVYNQTHYVDLEPPESWITLELEHDGNMITPYTEFTIWQEDFACGQPMGSQCCKIHYRIEGPPGQMYYTNNQRYVEVGGAWYTGDAGLDTPISFQIRDKTGQIKAGKYIVEFYAEDCFGNVEETVHRHFYFPDTTAPTTTLLFRGPTYSDEGYDWITSGTQITLTSSDVDSGVNSIYYRIDDGIERIYTAPFTLSGDGVHTIQYYARDMVGQAEDTQTQVVMVDSSGPETDVSFMGETHETSTVTWITDGTTLSVASSDMGCGLDMVYYRVDGGSWQTYSNSFTLPEGSYLLESYGVDHLGNSGLVESLAVGVDSSAPSVSYESPQASHLYIAGREIMVLPQSMAVDAVIIGPTSISARAQDTGVGVKRMELYIDGELRYSSLDDSLEFVWNQRTFLQHKIEVVTVDFFGYRSSKTLDLWIFNL